ncbi:MAG: hypothetical protein KAH77_02925 [Thiomargarita sp.]|nr:hypothetical protein [Thiomargarita sp.]
MFNIVFSKLKIVSLILTVLSLIGCSSPLIKISDANIVNRSEFEKKTDSFYYKADKNAFMTSILLSKPGGIIRFELPLSTFTEIETLQMITVGDSAGLNVDRFLLRNEEYFWDKEKNELLLRLKIPSTYLIRGQLFINFKIFGIVEEEDNIQIERRFNIFWKPINVKLSQDDENVFFPSLSQSHEEIEAQSGKFRVQQIVMGIFSNDLKKTDVSRMSPDYCKEIAAIADSFGSDSVECDK